MDMNIPAMPISLKTAPRRHSHRNDIAKLDDDGSHSRHTYITPTPRSLALCAESPYRTPREEKAESLMWILAVFRSGYLGLATGRLKLLAVSTQTTKAC